MEEEQNEEVVTTDNSEDTPAEEPQVDNSETGTDTEPAEEQQEDNSGTFKTLEEANKGYNELRTKFGQQGNELGELRKQAEEFKQLKEQIAQQELQTAQQSGFNSYQDYQNYHQMAEMEANEYMKHISECEFPDEMVNLINEYRRNPSKELLDTIESEFSTSTLKEVAANVTIAKGQLQQQQNEALQQQYYNEAEKYVETYVQKYEKDFLDPAFYNIYYEAFGTYGVNLDTDKFVELMHAYRDSVLKAHGIEKSISNENKSATDEIAGLSNGDSPTAGQEKDVLQMTESELKEYFRQKKRRRK